MVITAVIIPGGFDGKVQLCILSYIIVDKNVNQNHCNNLLNPDNYLVLAASTGSDVTVTTNPDIIAEQNDNNTPSSSKPIVD